MKRANRLPALLTACLLLAGCTAAPQSVSLPARRVLALKGLEALAKVADGRATKLIIPSDMQNLAGLVTSIKEMATADNAAK